MENLPEMIVDFTVSIMAILLCVFGFLLIKNGINREVTIIKMGNFELTLSTMAGGIFILSAAFIVFMMVRNFYQTP